MEWYRFEPRTLRAPEFALASERAQLTWFRLLNYCAEQENGGVLAGAAGWNATHWMTICGVRLAAVRDAGRLLVFQDDDVLVWGYPVGSEKGVTTGKEKAKAAAEARWAKHRAEKEAAGRAAPCSSNAPSIAASNAASNAVSNAEQKEQKEQKEIHTPLPPASGGAEPPLVGQTEAAAEARPLTSTSSSTEPKHGGASGPALPSEALRGKPRRGRAALAGEPIFPEGQPEPLRSRMLALATLVRRKSSTAWSEEELAALKKSGLLAAGDEGFAEQMDLMAAFCAPPAVPRTRETEGNPLRYRKVGLFRKLKNWAEECDKARAWVEQREAARRAALPPGRG